MSPRFELKWSEPKEMTPPETEGHMKGYFINPKNATLGATGCGGIKPFVDDLKRRVHLPLILKGLGDKLWGYKLASLVLLLVCRPQLGACSIAAVGEKLLCRFISRTRCGAASGIIAAPVEIGLSPISNRRTGTSRTTG